MSETGIKVVIILAAIAVAMAAKYIPYQPEKEIIEKVADEMIEEELK